MKNRICSVLLMALSASAFAGRPLTTEDAGFIDKGGVELETYYHRQTERDTAALSGFHIQPSVGIGFRTQLGIGVDFLRQYNEDFEKRKSTGEYALVGKTGIKELTDDAYGLAVAYGVDRTRAAGERFRYDNANINGALTVPLDKWLFHANLGWQRSRLAGVTATTWALAAERTEALGPVDLAIETFGNDHDPAWLQVAARWTVREDCVFLDASYGVQTGSTRAKQLTLGFKLAF